MNLNNNDSMDDDSISSIPAVNLSCPSGMFRCNNGKCITSLWVCNYQKDCDGGEDEQQSCRKYAYCYSLNLIEILLELFWNCIGFIMALWIPCFLI